MTMHAVTTAYAAETAMSPLCPYNQDDTERSTGCEQIAPAYLCDKNPVNAT
jgi:hypothetical protein